MRVGIVGCGYIAQRHLAALRRLRHVEVVAICDRNRERAAAVAQAHGIASVFHDFRDLLATAAPDVIHVLTPPQSHRALAIEALSAGCHVLVEKPMAMNAEEARAMLEAAARHGRRLGVCHNFRFIPAFLEARRLMERGALGRILSADVFWRMSSYEPSIRSDAVGWMQELHGGPLQEVMPHPVYVLAGLMGDLELSAVVTGGSESTEVRAVFASSRGPGTIALSLAARPVQKFVKVYGTEMSLHIDLATNVLLRMRGRVDSLVRRGLANLDHSIQLMTGTMASAAAVLTGRLSHGHEILIDRFYAALARGEAPPADGSEGLATVIVLDDLWQALGRDSVQRA